MLQLLTAKALLLMTYLIIFHTFKPSFPPFSLFLDVILIFQFMTQFSLTLCHKCTFFVFFGGVGSLGRQLMIFFSGCEPCGQSVSLRVRVPMAVETNPGSAPTTTEITDKGGDCWWMSFLLLPFLSFFD